MASCAFISSLNPLVNQMPPSFSNCIAMSASLPSALVLAQAEISHFINNVTVDLSTLPHDDELDVTKTA